MKKTKSFFNTMKTLPMKVLNHIKWVLYIATLIIGAILTVFGHQYCNDIMLSLGTGLIASWFTAFFIELINGITVKKRNRQNFILSNNDIRSELIRMLIVYNRILNSIAVAQKVNRGSFENKTFNELLCYYIEESKKIESYTVPFVATNGITSSDELEQIRSSNEINKIIKNVDEELKNIKKNIGEIAEKFKVAKVIQLTAGICTDSDVKSMVALFDIFTLKTPQIGDEYEFYQFAHSFDEMINCIPNFYQRLGLDKLKFSDKSGYLEIA